MVHDGRTKFDTLTDMQLTNLLRDFLKPSAPELDVDSKVADLERCLTKLARRAGAAVEGALAQAVRSAASPDELRQLKDLAKQLLGRAEEPAEREAAQLLYHLAIAAALVAYGLNISAQAPHERRDTFRDLATRFAGHRVGMVFERA